jgi:hypothetical protein
MPGIDNDGRWCMRCGGEQRHVRQRRGGKIYTWLCCLLCRTRRLMLVYEEATGDLTAGSDFTVPSCHT